MTYAYANHAVTGISTTQNGARFSMTYDAAGNMTNQSDSTKNMAKQMAYDSYNRIRQVTDPATGTVKGTYYYDDQGFRVRREARLDVDGVERRVQLLNPSMYFSVETVRELDGTPVGDTGFGVNNVYLNGVRMAAVLPNGEAQYYLTDQVDSVKVVTNDAGMVVTSHEYLPFGEDWITEGDTKNAPKYNSQELDKESGYYFYNARHYDPEIARFVTADTVIDGEFSTQGWNRYAYVHNNPIRYKDPTGHAKDDLKLADMTAKSGPNSIALNNPMNMYNPDLSSRMGRNNAPYDGAIKAYADKTLQLAKGPERLTGKDYRNILLDNFERNKNGQLVLDSNGYASSKIGGAVVKFKPGVGDPINSLNGMTDKAMKVFGDMATDEKLGIKEITVSSMKRGPGQLAHSDGRAFDITGIKSKNDEAIYNNESSDRSESQLAKNVRSWLNNRSEVNDVISPWKINHKHAGQLERDNEWKTNPSYHMSQDTVDYKHRNHLHFGVSQ